MKQFSIVLRWISILPLAFVLSILIPNIYQWIVSLFIPNNGFIHTFSYEYIAFYIGGTMFVIPSLIAPKYIKETSLILTTTFIVGAIVNVFLNRNSDGMFEILLQSTFGIIGALIMIYNTYKLTPAFIMSRSIWK